LLDDLRRLRGLQLLQRQALVDADGERLTALDRERMALQGGLVPLAASGLDGADLQEARALVELIERDQQALISAAVEARERIAAELRNIGPGKVALSGYRAPGTTNARYLDRVG
jgi:hypothetical protein